MLCFWHYLPLHEGGGRGGIRTHGGFPHARFRVECLKPDSATLPLRKRTSNPPTPKASAWQTLNVQHQTTNASITQISCLRGGRACYQHSWTSRGEFLHEPCRPWQTGLFASRGQKCYNFRLAMSGKFTASCVSTRTATLLLVVDRYSQVLGGAVHQYCQLIRTSTPPLPP
jgi:hypothetical protein